jgi:hypothetical protein
MLLRSSDSITNCTFEYYPRIVAISGICALLVAVQAGHAQSRPEVSPQVVKAYRTLSFGDNTETVDRKLAEIVGEEHAKSTIAETDIYHSETFWRSLFDTDAEYEPYRYDATHSTQSDKLESLMKYFHSHPIGDKIRRFPFVFRGNIGRISEC